MHMHTCQVIDERGVKLCSAMTQNKSSQSSSLLRNNLRQTKKYPTEIYFALSFGRAWTLGPCPDHLIRVHPPSRQQRVWIMEVVCSRKHSDVELNRIYIYVTLIQRRIVTQYMIIW